ncbi:MAG: DUF4166 domain-containing protein [Pseudomonadota bacterium]
MIKTVLILGGYGVFGGRLAKRLAQDSRMTVIIAGRNLEEATAFAKGTRLISAVLDVTAVDLLEQIRALSPDVIIDAVGPFQDYSSTPYRVAEIAIQIGAHYLDLSDDAEFTEGIAHLDESARIAGVTVLSGVSSVPAISSVVASDLSRDLDDIHSVETVILPGNRAPRGMSVMRSILGQVGRPLHLWQANRFIVRPAWSDLREYDLSVPGTPALPTRRASLIGAPDLILLPKTLKARSVTFRAGLELSIMQFGLWMLHWLPRLKLTRSLIFLVPLLKWLADRLEPLGSDRGGMLVEVTGTTRHGLGVRRRWTLIVEQGDGPYIPGVPAQAIIQKLRAGECKTGARPCLGAFTIAELDAGFEGLSISTGSLQQPIQTVFESILGDDYLALPKSLQDLHQVLYKRRWQGSAQIERGANLFARCAGWIAGFPPASKSTPVEVEMTRTAKGETWIRQFGKKRFRSHLSAVRHRGELILQERFGWMTFGIRLRRDAEALHFPVSTGRVFGIPLPAFMVPKSETREFVDEQGRSCFDVRISTPMTGLIAHYHGYLTPAEPDSGSQFM